jgi:hypothetical protein
VPLPDLLAWAWPRWDVAVMHRELKRSFGVGDPQAWSDAGAASVVAWAVWVSALLVLAGDRTWGDRPPPGPDRGAWWRPRHWSLGRLLQETRTEVWALGALQPRWQRTPDTWGDMTTWTATRLPSVLGCRRL